MSNGQLEVPKSMMFRLVLHFDTDPAGTPEPEIVLPRQAWGIDYTSEKTELGQSQP